MSLERSLILSLEPHGLILHYGYPRRYPRRYPGGQMYPRRYTRRPSGAMWDLLEAIWSHVGPPGGLPYSPVDVRR